VVLTVGESPRNDYIIPSEGIPDEFPLVTVSDDSTAYLALTDDMTGTIRARDKIYSVAEVVKEKFTRKQSGYYVLPLKQDDFAKVSIGRINFFVLYVKPAQRIKPAPIFDKDPLVMRTAIGSFLLFFLLMLATALVEKPKPVTIEMVPERFARIVIKKKPKVAQPAQDGIVAKNEESKQGGSVMGEGGPAKGPEGEAGRKNLPKKAEKPQVIMPKSKPKGPPAVAAPPKPTPEQQKLANTKRAKSVGLLKAFSQSGIQKDVKALIDKGEGPEGPGGFDDFGKAVSGFRGKTLEEVGGAGGKGLKGVDVGGGGKTVGIDGPSTKGLGRGYYGDGIGEGIGGPGRFGQKGEHAINIINENIQILSGLSKDVINAVVNRYRSQIRACYDAALQRNPGTRGKIVVAFSIQPSGVVSSASVKESTIGDSALETCILSRIRSWPFPRPEAPVVTEVTAYPFYLSPAN
jgi:TonB family protein